ncbi:hypothetical protein FHS29_006226 [Saccharothrix tamanrassetensis]|uniref:Uncharacterized protein n=1 Tax=Saccharothrix tamanrassetensis TaxID=1051531 RepID=A0A841CUI3_9PSEU|nr:hypothetical protein [Saccharothrix tamanrassetensis]
MTAVLELQSLETPQVEARNPSNILSTYLHPGCPL